MATAVKRVRDTRIDNATGVLIVLVVWGHLLETLPGDAAHDANLWLYTFHMPAFVFVSGYVTRYASRWSPMAIATKLLFPYLVFTVIQRLLVSWWKGTAFHVDLIAVQWTLWYLLALTAWRLAAPVFARMRFSWGVALTALISVVAAGLPWVGKDLSLGRILGFLPFFVAGMLWKERWTGWLVTRWSWAVGLAVLGAGALWAIAAHGDARRTWWFFSHPPLDLQMTSLEAMTLRATLIVTGAVLGLALLSIVMRSMPVLPSIGAASLVVYLLHGIVLFSWHIHGAPADLTAPIFVPLGLGASAVFAWLVSRPPVVRATRPLMDITWWSGLVSRRRERRSAS